jgi:hypothetical protein
MHPNTDLLDPVERAIYFTLFKITSTAELAGAERAVDWAESVLEDEDLLRSFAAGTREEPGA